MNYTKIVEILQAQVKPALGCTEPVAVALAASRANKELEGNIENIIVKVSPNIYKNGMRVGIPGTSEIGIPFATALSLVCGDPDLGLEVFDGVNDEFIAAAKALERRNIISVDVESNKARFYIEATITTDQGTATCIIQDKHTNIVHVEKDGKIIFEKQTGVETSTPSNEKQAVNKLGDLTLKQLREIIETIPYEKIKFLSEGPKLNLRMANVGLNEKPGLGIGAGLNALIKQGILENNLINNVRSYTAAATDARMAGIKLPVMSSAGSGNHGITAIVPPVIVCDHFGYDEEKLMRALAFSHLVTIYIKEFTGSLSPICGCAIAAGMGASAASAWLMGCSDEQIAGAIKNMSGDLAGMLCDGAKGGCALKLSTASGEAVLSAILAKQDIFISEPEGIVGKDAESTIRNLGKLCVQGMKDLDKDIIDVMLTQ